MARNKQDLIELAILFLVVAWLFFTSTNINPILGNTYNGLITAAMVAVIADAIFGKRDIKFFNPEVSWVKSIFIAFVGYAAILLSSEVATLASKVVPLTQLLQALSASAPVFSNSAIFNFINFGQVIPYIETIALFVYGLDLLASVVNVPVNAQGLKSWKSILIISLMAFFFMLLHVTAKGITNTTTLLVVFFMAIISMVIAFLYRDGRTVVLVHVIANTVASLNLFSVILPLIGITIG